MESEEIFARLRTSLERTGYVSNIHIFPGEFHQDSRQDKHAHITYLVDTSRGNKESEMHKLEREIRQGLYKQWHNDCHIRTCIEPEGDSLEKHTIHVSFNRNEERKERRIAVMATQLTKIIDNYHYKRR